MSKSLVIVFAKNHSKNAHEQFQWIYESNKQMKQFELKEQKAIVQDLGIVNFSLGGFELDLQCLDDMNMNFRVMDQVKELNLPSVDHI